MSAHQDDSAFVRNFSLVLLGLVVIGLIAFVLAKLVNDGAQETYGTRVAVSNVEPVGALNTGTETVSVAGAKNGAEVASTTAAPAVADSSDPGKATYDKICFACHAQGIAGAPKFGDVAAWETRLAQGRDTLVQHAIVGYTGQAGMMPARGGNPTLTDAEVGASVDYMVAAVGGKNDSAAAPTAAPVSEPVAVTDSVTPPADVAVAAAPAVADAGKGKATYDAVCFVCHTPGAAGAPKFGDKVAWAPRIEKGVEVLHSNSINGYMGSAGMMPPKGGRPDIADADIKAAVDYMVEAVK